LDTQKPINEKAIRSDFCRWQKILFSARFFIFFIRYHVLESALLNDTANGM